MTLPLTLIGEEIAGEWNAIALADIAQAFGGDYLAYNCQGENPTTPGASGSGSLSAGEEDVGAGAASGAPTVPFFEEKIASEEALRCFDCLIAAENRPDSRNVYEFRPPAQGRHALLVGNEAKGLRRRTLKRASAIVEIPLVSKNINCLNVAAAAAVMLYYLTQPEPLALKRRTLTSIQKNRPDILLIGGTDAMELGSAIRSACAFGWEHLFLLDRGNAWYECDRIIKSEGRGAARRGRNPIKVLPYREDISKSYRKCIVFTANSHAKRPQTLPMADKDTLIVLEDSPGETGAWLVGNDQEVVYAALPIVAPEHYHFRQMASIALAEIVRQLGQPDGEGLYLRSKKQRYRKEVEADTSGTTLDLDDLLCF